MGDPTTKIQNLSVAPRWASGFITNGKFLKFNSPYPQSSTDLKGVELSLDFKEWTPDNKDKDKLRGRRVGELALMYYYGRSDDHFDQSDLPLGDNPLVELIQFSATRDARSHFLITEWRWPLFSPVYQGKHLRLIQPQYSLGLGGMYIKTKVTQEGETEYVSKRAGYVTSSTQLRIVELSVGPVNLSWEASVRMLAGQTYGIMAETGLRLTYRR